MDLLEFRARVAQWEPELVKTLPSLPSGLVEEYIAIPPTQTQAQDLSTQPQSPSPSPKILKITRPLHPPSPSSPTPLILLFHGGGFCGGSIEQLTRPAREFAAAFRAVVVCASYALTPEHPFPAGVEDAYGTVLWVGRNAEEVFGVKLRGNSKESGGGSAFVVGGVSAGGNIAAALAPLVIARGELPEGLRITGSFLVIPRLLVEEIVPTEYKALWTSREENKDCSNSSGGHGSEGGSATGTGAGDGRPSRMMLTPSLIASMYTALAPDVRSTLFSPFNYANATQGEDVLRQLPRTYLQVGERDILRDDGVVYERFLEARGVEVKLDVNPGLGHVAYTVFMQRGGEVEESVQEGVKERTVEGMRWLLGM